MFSRHWSARAQNFSITALALSPSLPSVAPIRSAPDVDDWTDESHTVLAYDTNATLAVGAWEHYAPQYPQRN